MVGQALKEYTKDLKAADRNWKNRITAKHRYEQAREAEAKEAELNSMVDEPTGLWNRRYFEIQLTNEMDKASRKEYQKALSLIIFDMDELKQINDEQGGHLVGDLALRSLVEIVQGPHHAATSELSSGRLRKKQVIRETDILCRYAGDEFILILPETDLTNAALVAERIRSNIDSQSERKSGIHFTASLGVAEFKPGQTRDEFFNMADQVLYESKEKGKNQVTVAV